MIKICKYSLLLTFLLCFSSLEAQQVHAFRDIRGEVTLCDSNKTIAVLYREDCCCACMQSLCNFLQAICDERNIRFAVMLSGKGDIAMRRMTTANAQGYFAANNKPYFVYDYSLNNQKSYSKKFRISNFPAILLFSPNQKNPSYISYSQIFTNDEDLLNKTFIKKIQNFISN